MLEGFVDMLHSRAKTIGGRPSSLRLCAGGHTPQLARLPEATIRAIGSTPAKTSTDKQLEIITSVLTPVARNDWVVSTSRPSGVAFWSASPCHTNREASDRLPRAMSGRSAAATICQGNVKQPTPATPRDRYTGSTPRAKNTDGQSIGAVIAKNRAATECHTLHCLWSSQPFRAASSSSSLPAHPPPCGRVSGGTTATRGCLGKILRVVIDPSASRAAWRLR